MHAEVFRGDVNWSQQLPLIYIRKSEEMMGGERDGWVDRHMIQPVKLNVNGRISVVDVWMVSVQFF